MYVRRAVLAAHVKGVTYGILEGVPFFPGGGGDYDVRSGLYKRGQFRSVVFSARLVTREGQGQLRGEDSLFVLVGRRISITGPIQNRISNLESRNQAGRVITRFSLKPDTDIVGLFDHPAGA